MHFGKRQKWPNLGGNNIVNVNLDCIYNMIVFKVLNPLKWGILHKAEQLGQTHVYGVLKTALKQSITAHENDTDNIGLNLEDVLTFLDLKFDDNDGKKEKHILKLN